MYTIPKDLVARWEVQKAGFQEATAKAHLVRNDKHADWLKNDLPRMLREFDQGLKSKMRAAASAKDDASARKAAAAVAKVAMDYRKILQDYGERTELQGRKTTDKAIILMEEIAHHAEASVRSRPPIRAPRDFHDSTIAKLKAAAAADPKASDEQKVSAVKLAEYGARDLMLNDLTKAKSDPALHDAAKKSQAMIAAFRRDIDKWATTRGRAAVPTKQALHKVLDNTERIILDVLDDLQNDIHRTKSAD